MPNVLILLREEQSLHEINYCAVIINSDMFLHHTHSSQLKMLIMDVIYDPIVTDKQHNKHDTDNISVKS